MLNGIAIVLAGLCVFAQGQETFKGRLSPVAMDATMKANVAGTGSVSAVLAGTKLTITGSFDGMRSPATVAQLHQGIATGVRGPAILDLTVAKATNGNVTGSFELTPEQIEGLKKGKLYVQIHSEKAPDGNLWGWLLR